MSHTRRITLGVAAMYSDQTHWLPLDFGRFRIFDDGCISGDGEDAWLHLDVGCALENSDRFMSSSSMGTLVAAVAKWKTM